MQIPLTITESRPADFYLLSRDGVRMGCVFRVAGGWASVSASPRRWHRSRPFPTAAEAAADRWGDAGRDAIVSRRTSAAKEAA